MTGLDWLGIGWLLSLNDDDESVRGILFYLVLRGQEIMICDGIAFVVRSLAAFVSCFFCVSFSLFFLVYFYFVFFARATKYLMIRYDTPSPPSILVVTLLQPFLLVFASPTSDDDIMLCRLSSSLVRSPVLRSSVNAKLQNLKAQIAEDPRLVPTLRQNQILPYKTDSCLSVHAQL